MKKIEEWAINQQSLIMDFQVDSKNSGFKWLSLSSLKLEPFDLLSEYCYFIATHTYTHKPSFGSYPI